MEIKTIDVLDLKVSYSDMGNGKNILILHGWGASHESWLEVQKDLAERGFRVIVPDLPGFGSSEEPKSPWGLKDYSEFVHEFSRVTGLDKFALAGHSFGGRVAIDYSVRYPKDFRYLVLISAAGIVRHKKAKINGILAFTKAGGFMFSLPILSFTRPIVEKVWYKISGLHDYPRASKMMKAIMQRVLNEELRSHLPNILMPTLILWGEKDLATPLSDGIIIHENVPTSYLHVFKGMPHAINLKNPHGVAEKMAEFLA
ncbi:MAG: alpha/beta hydrolase [Candidatus Spechtbacterales bacterium]